MVDSLIKNVYILPFIFKILPFICGAGITGELFDFFVV